jgi:hypothetical protein
LHARTTKKEKKEKNKTKEKKAEPTVKSAPPT